ECTAGETAYVLGSSFDVGFCSGFRFASASVGAWLDQGYGTTDGKLTGPESLNNLIDPGRRFQMEKSVDTAPNPKLGGILITVNDEGSGVPIAGARIKWEGPFDNMECAKRPETAGQVQAPVQTWTGATEPNGSLCIKDLMPGWYRITCEAFFQRQ